MSKDIFEIKETMVPKVLDFILKAKHELINTFGLRDENIKILMPEYIDLALEYYNRERINLYQKGTTIYGISFSYHFQNEIVVYTEKFYLRGMEKSQIKMQL